MIWYFVWPFAAGVSVTLAIGTTLKLTSVPFTTGPLLGRFGLTPWIGHTPSESATMNPAWLTPVPHQVMVFIAPEAVGWNT